MWCHNPVGSGVESAAVLPAGDLRRALASTERLCLVLGNEGAFELRDVAALYLHAEDLPAAMTHLNAYAASSAAKGTATFLYTDTVQYSAAAPSPSGLLPSSVFTPGLCAENSCGHSARKTIGVCTP